MPGANDDPDDQDVLKRLRTHLDDSGAVQRFVIETTAPAQAESAVAAVFGFPDAAALRAAGVRVQPLLKADRYMNPAYELERYLLLTVPIAASISFSRADAFDLAYTLRDRAGFIRVDPDVPDQVVQPPSTELEARPVMRSAEGEPRTDAADVIEPSWALRNMRVDKAWALKPPPGGKAKGEGIVIAHPDTGWAKHTHINLKAYDLNHAWNLLDETSDALDPLFSELEHLLYPGHGTATSSVLVSLSPKNDKLATAEFAIAATTANLLTMLGRMLLRVMGWLRAVAALLRAVPILRPRASVVTQPSPAHRLLMRPRQRMALQAASKPAGLQPSGVAPLAKIIPIRCTETVIILSGVNLARAIDYAANSGAHVISISLGGIPTPWLEAAITHAVRDHNCIVCAAAGQPLPLVIAPALYPDCIAVAATNRRDQPWKLSGRGPSVAISAPGEDIWRATFDRKFGMKPIFAYGTGTSFAAPHVAGVAALWLAFHGRDRLIARYGETVPLQFVFRHLLRQTMRIPASWGAWERANFAGIIDAEALLRARLPDPAVVIAEAGTWRPTPGPEVLEATAEDARAQLRHALGMEDVSGAELDALMERYDAELLRVLASSYGAPDDADPGFPPPTAFAPDTPSNEVASAEVTEMTAVPEPPVMRTMAAPASDDSAPQMSNRTVNANALSQRLRAELDR